MSLVFLSLSSPWQWNTVTPISGVPWRQHAAVWLSHFPTIEHPACQHFFHIVLPTATLLLLLLVVSFHSSSPPPSLYSLLFRHSLYPTMAASKIRAKQKVNIPVNICSVSPLARSLWCSILRLISLSASGERHFELLAYGMLQGIQNALVELKIQHMLQTALCDVTKSRHPLSLGSGAHTWHEQQGVYWYNSLLR